MVDYYQLIARAVTGFHRNTDEARRAAIYEHARGALVIQLCSLVPPLTGSEIMRERLSLDEAIRKIEAEVTHGPQAEAAHPVPAPNEPQQEPISPEQDGPAAAGREPSSEGAAPRFEAKSDETGTPGQESDRDSPATLSRRSLPSAEGLKIFREGVAEAERLSETQIGDARAYARPYNVPDLDRFEPGIEPRRQSIMPRIGEVEPDMPRPPPMTQWQAGEPIKLRQAVGLLKTPMARFLGVFLVVALVAVVLWFVKGPADLAQQEAAPPRPEILDRLGHAPQQSSSAAGQMAQDRPYESAAQHALLYEEDPIDARGKRYVGSVIWRTEPVFPGQGQALAIHAQLEIPERHISMTMSIRRNTDKALAASHTIEIMFNLPADFPFGGISKVSAIMMKETEEALGTSLAGLTVNVTSESILFALSAAEGDMQRNMKLLEGRSWFDIPIVYNSGQRAIVAIEKGIPGEGAFREAFAAWRSEALH
jgi:hypothetical protein